MEHLIEVAFKGNRREFFRWTFEAPPPVRAAIIVDVERGEDLGHVHATGELAERRKSGTTHGKEQREPLRAALRLATVDDIARADTLRADNEEARRFAVQKARALGLQMKVSDAEWQWDRRRLTFYFTAEERVDFRTLVRQLESHFGVRVQMWHIGPRDEAKRLDGVGHCGRQLCSASWLPELLPVKTSLAKEQRLSTITPTQISGACGRLMCCLRYEHEFYVQARKRFPKHGKIVQTLQGEEKVDGTDIFRDLVTLRNPTGETRTIPLAQFRRELAGEAMPMEVEVHEGDDEADEEQAEHRVAESPRARDLSQLQRAPAAPREPGGTGPRRDARSDARSDARRDPRGEQRSGESRRDARPDQRPGARPERRTEPRQPHGADARAEPQPSSHPPVREQDGQGAQPAERQSERQTGRVAERQPARAPERPQARPEPPREREPSEPRAPLAGPAAAAPPEPSAPHDDGDDAADAAGPQGDGDPRRGRRRRGRRGGRRHRGDGHNHGNSGGAPGSPDAPSSNTDS